MKNYQPPGEYYKAMEVNLNLYKGFVRTKGKQPIDKLKSGVYREWEEIKQYNSYAGVLQDDVILIDIDDTQQSDILMNIVEQKQINTYVYQTSRGRHFLFKNDNRITKCYTHTRLACGLYADIKIGSATSVQALKVDGEERFCEWGFDNLVDTIPTFLFPVKSNIDLLDLKEGDGRNDQLYRYILDLVKSGLSKEESRDILEVVNNYIFKEKLSTSELTTIARDEAFPEDTFFEGQKFLHDKFANYLKLNDHICRINGQLHIYNGKIYVAGYNAIENRMIKYIPTLRSQQRKEVLQYLEVICDKNLPVKKNVNLIAFDNGIYDINTKQLLDFSPNYHITNLIPHNYQPGSYDSTVDDVFNRLSCDDKDIRAVIEEAIGFCFYRKNELSQTTFIFVGDKANGKSTLLAMIKRLLGYENYAALDMEELDERFSTIQLANKLANIGDDLSNNFLQGKTVSTFKKVASGNTLKGEFKGKDIVYFEPYCKQFYSTNDLARMKDPTGAILRRLLIIPMNAYFSKDNTDYDPYIIDKLTSENAMEYLINISLEGLQRVLANNGFTTTSAINEQLDDFNRANNPLINFVEECECDSADYLTTTPITTIYSRYTVYCEDNGFMPENRTTFSKRLATTCGLKSYPKRLNGNVVRYFTKQ